VGSKKIPIVFASKIKNIFALYLVLILKPAKPQEFVYGFSLEENHES